MALRKLIPELQSLSKTEKLQALQFLANELAKEEGVTPFEDGASYPVYTPLHAEQAGHQLLDYLKQQTGSTLE